MDELHDFLRRAAERRQQQLKQQKQQAAATESVSPPPRREPPRRETPPSEPPVRETQQETRRLVPQATNVAQVQAELAEIVDESSQRSSRATFTSVDTRGDAFDTRAANFTHDVDLADEKMDAHLHSHFDHDLGDLGAGTASATASDATVQKLAKTTVKNIVQMLKSPQQVRHAIILSEIFNRPSDRW